MSTQPPSYVQYLQLIQDMIGQKGRHDFICHCIEDAPHLETHGLRLLAVIKEALAGDITIGCYLCKRYNIPGEVYGSTNFATQLRKRWLQELIDAAQQAEQKLLDNSPNL